MKPTQKHKFVESNKKGKGGRGYFTCSNCGTRRIGRAASEKAVCPGKL